MTMSDTNAQLQTVFIIDFESCKVSIRGASVKAVLTKKYFKKKITKLKYSSDFVKEWING